MATHITQCDSPELLPLARSRIKALKASGLKYASQRFDVGGSSVAVRVIDGHEFISIGNKRLFLWVLIARKEGVGGVGTKHTWLYRVPLPAPAGLRGNKTGVEKKLSLANAALYYEGATTTTQVGIFQDPPAVNQTYTTYNGFITASVNSIGFGAVDSVATYGGKAAIATYELSVSSGTTSYNEWTPATTKAPGGYAYFRNTSGTVNDYVWRVIRKPSGDSSVSEAFPGQSVYTSELATGYDTELTVDTATGVGSLQILNTGRSRVEERALAPNTYSASGGVVFDRMVEVVGDTDYGTTPAAPRYIFMDPTRSATITESQAQIVLDQYTYIGGLSNDPTKRNVWRWEFRELDQYGNNSALNYILDLRNLPRVAGTPDILDLMNYAWPAGWFSPTYSFFSRAAGWGAASGPRTGLQTVGLTGKPGFPDNTSLEITLCLDGAWPSSMPT